MQTNQAYDERQIREKACLAWLKEVSQTVRQAVYNSIFLAILNGGLVVIQAALLAYLLDRLVVGKQSWERLSDYLAALCLVFLLRAFVHYFLQLTGFNIAARVKQQVRQQLLADYSLPLRQPIQSQSSGTLVTTMVEHTEALEGYFSRYLPQQYIAVILPVLICLVSLPVNWVVSVIFLVTAPLVPLFMVLVGMGAASVHRQQFLAMARMNGYFLDRLQGLLTLKLLGQGQAELSRIQTISGHFYDQTMAVLKIALLSSAVLEFFSAIAVALVAVYVGLALLGLIHFEPASNMTLQQALFLLLLAPEFFMPLKQLAAFYHDKAAAIGAADHILNQLNRAKADTESAYWLHLTDDRPFCIEFKHISKSYQDRVLFKNLNLTIRPGEKIAISGYSGQGKTTLLKLMLGLTSPDQGEIRVNPKLAGQTQQQPLFAWLPQKPGLLYASIKDNISLFNPTLSDQQISSAAEAAGVMTFASKLPEMLHTRVGEKGYGLSAGQQQRVALARILLSDAAIILLDEPTAHLDQHTKSTLLVHLLANFQKKTVIVSTHDPYLIAQMDREINLSVLCR